MKLPTAKSENVIAVLVLATNLRFGALFTRSDTYFGFAATFSRSVKVAEFSQSRIMWLTIWSRFLLEKKSQISLSESKSASDLLSSFKTRSRTSGCHSFSERGKSSRTLFPSWSENLMLITTGKWTRFYLKLLLLNYQMLS